MATDQLARGIAARTFATARSNSISIEEFGARATGDSRAAIQRAIDLAVANGIPRVTSRLPRLEVWEKVMPYPTFTTIAEYYANRTLAIPGCGGIEIDFAGARITLKGPTGGARYPGQTSPTAASSGFAASGKYLGGFITVAGPITGTLAIRNVEVDGGFTGDNVGQSEVNAYDKGFIYQDLSDGNLGAGLGAGTTIMENVVLHGFAGEIMYDNSSKEHFSRDCHFYNSGHSCWNPGGVGRLVAYNLQAGLARQPFEVVGGVGHTYIGGRFYKGEAGVMIGGPDPAFDGIAYNNPVRRTDAAPPYIVFQGTRFEEYSGFLYLGSYMRGSIICTDVAIFLAAAFASNSELKDIDLDVYATCDRKTAYYAVRLAGPASNDGSQPKTTHLRIHCARTKLAVENGRSMVGLGVSGFVDAATCSIKVDGNGTSPFNASYVAGSVLPLIDASGFQQSGNPDFLYFASDQTYTIASRSVNLYPTASGTFNFDLDTAPGYTPDQLFTFYHGGGGSADRILSFAQNGAGMKLNATRILRRPGDYLTLRRSSSGTVWVEHAFVGDEGPQTIPVLATAIIPNTTSGPAAGLTENGANKVMLATLDFDPATAEAAQVAIPMPRSWDEGAVAVQFVWTAVGGANAGVV